MSDKDRDVNGVNGTQATSEGVTSGRVAGGQQPGRYPNTARTKWSKDLNKLVMKCYIKSNPGTRGYRKRMFAISREVGEFEINEQRLADQARAIKINGWLSDIEIEELKREVDNEGEDCEEGSKSTYRGNELTTETDDEPQPTCENNMHTEMDGGDSKESMSRDIEGLPDEEKSIYNRIMEVVNGGGGGGRDRMQEMRKVNRGKLRVEVKKVNKVLGKMASEEITTTNDLIYAGAVVVTEELGARVKKGTKPKEPMWKRRLSAQVKGMRRDLSRVEVLLQGRKLREHHKGELEQKYKIAELGLKHVAEDLKQRITAKVQRYENRNKQFYQNRLFETDQRKFYNKISGDKISPDLTLD